MNLCSHNHSEVCFQDRDYCPACSLLEKIQELHDTIAELRDQIKEKDQEIESLLRIEQGS